MLDILIREDAILSANITKVTSFIEAAKAEYTLKKYEIEESYTQYDEYDNAFIYEEADGEVAEGVLPERADAGHPEGAG